MSTVDEPSSVERWSSASLLRLIDLEDDPGLLRHTKRSWYPVLSSSEMCKVQSSTTYLLNRLRLHLRRGLASEPVLRMHGVVHEEIRVIVELLLKLCGQV